MIVKANYFRAGRRNSVLARAGVSCSILMLAIAVTVFAPAGCGGTGALPPSDTTAPRVISVTPDHGVENVPVNTTILITFSEAMDASSINKQTIRLSENNNDVAVEVTYSGRTAEVKPASNLRSETWYKVTVDASVRDAAGNAMGGSDYTIFKTGVAPDPTPPEVSSTSPVNGATNVTINSNIMVTFSELMDASTVTAGNFVLRDGAAAIGGNIVPFGATFIFTPNDPLNYSTDYSVAIIRTAKDLAGNQMVSDFTWTFRTASPAEDTISPDVLATDPENGQIGVSVSKQIVASFSETMLSSSITATTFALKTLSGAGVPGNVTASGATAIFNPAQPLAYDTVYIATITTGVTDLAGNPLNANPSDGYSWSFTTRPYPVYTIYASAGSDGSISPAGSVEVNYGGSQSFSISANPGYHIANVMVDGNTVGAVASYTFTNVTADHTISASFALTTHAITASATGSGSISPSGAVTVNDGANTVFTISPMDGYHAVMGGTCGGTLSGDGLSYTTTTNAITGNCTVIANFVINTYTITTSAGTGGSITPANPSVNYGADQTFLITPDAGYHVDNVLVDGSSVGAVTSYQFTNVTGPHSISATFAIDTRTITVSAGPNGTISYGGVIISSGTTSNVTVNYGASPVFTFTPDTGYRISLVMVDGVDKGLPNSYTFTNITLSHTLVVDFAQSGSVITATAGVGGTISTGGTIILSGTSESFYVSYGGSRSFTVAANSGYHISGIWIDNSSSSIYPPTTSYTFDNVTTDHSISAEFAVDTFTINFASDGNGTLSGTASQTVNYGGSTTAVSATPLTGYHFVNWTGTNGFITTTANPITVTNVTASQTITANFAVDTFTISFVPGSNGTLSGTATQTANYGGSTTAVSAIPLTGYHFVNWTGTNGFITTSANPLTLADITVSQTITANFEPNSYVLTVDKTGTGSGTIGGGGTYLYGATASPTAAADPGSTFTGWSGACSGTSSPTSVVMDTDKTCTATFTLNSYTLTVDKSGTGSGTVGGGGLYFYGAIASPTAVADTGSTFTGWSGACTGNASPTSILMDADKTCTATFTLNSYILTVDKTGTGSGTITGAGIYAFGDTATVTAEPDENSIFSNWSGACTSSDNPTTVLMDSDKLCNALFTLK